MIRLVLLFVMFSGSVIAASNEPYVPEPLQPWKAWVLEKHTDIDCPKWFGNDYRSICEWPSHLKLDVQQQQISFAQQWTLYRDFWVQLPGDPSYWPLDVTANQSSVEVMARSDLPSVFLRKGHHLIEGTIRFEKRPQSIRIPAGSALVSLQLDGNRIDRINIEKGGRLWFGESNATQPSDEQQDRIRLQVFRKITDGVPVKLETQLRLTVAGQDRELSLGRFLEAGGTPIWFESPLPARLEDDGRLRIQVRAGQWNISLLTRQEESEPSFKIERLDDDWPTREIWLFEADRDVRTVELSGAVIVDSSLSDIPQQWLHLPAYLMEEDTRLLIRETSQGESVPAADNLDISRDFWLDFDGDGMTVKDRIRGDVNRAWRMSVSPGVKLGRADLNGTPQLITRMGEEVDEGLELRQGNLSLETVSRIDLTAASDLSVTGWQYDFNSIKGMLNLPPGWLLLHAGGVDRATGSWIEKWDLWDSFLLLLVAAAMARLMGFGWGLLAFATVGLTYHDWLAPLFIWLVLAATVALIRQIPAGTLKKGLSYFQYLSLLSLVLMSILYSVDQIRKGIYPQIETPVITGVFSSPELFQQGSFLRRSKPSALSARARRQDMELERVIENVEVIGSTVRRENFLATARIQTGPSEPHWQWNRHALLWDGPVKQNQNMHFYLLSPAVHGFLRALKIGLLGVLVFGLMVHSVGVGKSWVPKFLQSHVASVAALALVMATSLPSPVQADLPTGEMLRELEARLLAPPRCSPQCVSMEKGQLVIKDRQVTLQLNIDVLAVAVVSLPVVRNSWTPVHVKINGQSAVMVSSEGKLRVAVEPGKHLLTLEGPVTADALEMVFELPAHNLTIDAERWQVTGLVEGRVPGGSLQLTRQQTDAKSTDDSALIANPVEPFVSVDRTLKLGLKWGVFTEVHRVAPMRGTAINLEIPLLDGESVTSDGVKTAGNRVRVVIPANSDSFSWESSLLQKDQINLTMVDNLAWTEKWMLDVSPIWHIGVAGINPVKSDIDLPTWLPRSGESITIDIERPQAVEGAVHTVESVHFNHTPGSKEARNALTLIIRSSQGSEYPITLPQGADVRKVMIDGIEQINQNESPIRLPIHPGKQDITIEWNQAGGIGLHHRTPSVGLPTPPGNINLTLHLPRDRWPLFVGGPTMGPALLYWGVLITIVIVALLLGMTKVTPLRSWQWLLLGIGMSTVNVPGSIVVVLWFFAIAGRGKISVEMSRLRFNLMQTGLILLTIAAFYSLISTIPASLLSSPQMQISGNGSSDYLLRWYQDRSVIFPTGWVISVPIWIYRLAMLLWSLWIVFSLLSWVRWSWGCFSSGRIWMNKQVIAMDATVANAGSVD